MSIFAIIRSAKKAADEKKSAAAEEKPRPAPYRHVPTHAAVDALSGTPSSWKTQDAKAIKAYHKRRSEMLTRNSSPSTSGSATNPSTSYNGLGWSQRPGFPRSGSAFSALSGVPGPSSVSAQMQTPLGINDTPAPPSDHAPSSISSSQIMEVRPVVNRFENQSIFEQLHKGQGRKVGEAPLYDTIPATEKPAPSARSAERKAPGKKAWLGKRRQKAIAMA